MSKNLQKPLKEKPPTRPPYQGKYEEMVEVFQKEFAVTKKEDPKPVLTTYGLGPCIAIVGWSPKHKIGFLTHYDSSTELSSSFGRLLYKISQQLGSETSKFDVRIIGGYTNQSEQIIVFLKSRLNINEKIKMGVIEEDILGYHSLKRNVVLDTRTGETFSYNPKLNPNRREMTKLEKTLIYSGIKSTARLIYSPEIR